MQGAIKWSRLSFRRFKATAVRPHLHTLAHNLGNFIPAPAVAQRSLTTLRKKLIKSAPRSPARGDTLSSW